MVLAQTVRQARLNTAWVADLAEFRIFAINYTNIKTFGTDTFRDLGGGGEKGGLSGSEGEEP